MSSSFSHYSVVQVAQDSSARLLFPGCGHLPKAPDCHTRSAGYVRSEGRAVLSLRYEQGLWRRGNELPFRDYENNVVSDIGTLHREGLPDQYVVISCRNIMNEWGYQARIGGSWWRRYADPPIDPDWPVLSIGDSQIDLQPLRNAELAGSDLVTGIPLVKDGHPFDRTFFVANCSDVAHTFETHPKGLIGPSATAWFELSNVWQSMRDQGCSEPRIAEELERLAVVHRVRKSVNVLHSVVAQVDKEILFVALVGPLDRIAWLLAEVWGAKHAIMLDNGGSVGWRYIQKRGESIVLVSGPNYRPSGTAFLAIRTQGFLQPQMHRALV